jgi:hypothetical protein
MSTRYSNPDSKRSKIGVITVTEPFVRRKLYETAAWYKDIEVPPGEYPVYYSKDIYVERYVIEYKGKVIADNFDTLFGGVIISPKRNQYVGDVETAFEQFYTYQLSQIEAMPGFRYERA